MNPASLITKAWNEGIGGLGFASSPWQAYMAVAMLERERRRDAIDDALIATLPTADGARTIAEDEVRRIPAWITPVSAENLRGRRSPTPWATIRHYADLRRRSRRGPAFAAATSGRGGDPWWWRWADTRGDRRLRLLIGDDGAGSYLPSKAAAALREQVQAWRAPRHLRAWSTGVDAADGRIFKRRGGRCEVEAERVDDLRATIRTMTRAKAGIVSRDAVLYLSQPVHEFGIRAEDETQLLTSLQRLVPGLCVKPHPRQDPDAYERMGLPVVAPDTTMEALAVHSPPAAVIGLFSTALVTAQVLADIPTVALGASLAAAANAPVGSLYAAGFERRFGHLVPAAPNVQAAARLATP